MNIVSVDKVVIYPEHREILERIGSLTVYADVPDESEGIRRIKEADIVIDNWMIMPAHVIRACPRLKMISVAATGYEWVDLQETRKRNIAVCNSPNYATNAVAEHTFGLLLNAARLSGRAYSDLQKHIYKPFLYKGKELRGKTIGIIGYGHIGRHVASLAQSGFGMHVIYTDSKSPRTRLEELLKQSDFISVNAPLNERTKNMLSAKEFNLMKRHVVIVNTGRGAVIDEKALLANLKNGKVFSVGLDVLTDEPMNLDSSLIGMQNVFITPHIGFNTEESEYRLSEIVTENIVRHIQGKPQNVVS